MSVKSYANSWHQLVIYLDSNSSTVYSNFQKGDTLLLAVWLMDEISQGYILISRANLIARPRPIIITVSMPTSKFQGPKAGKNKKRLNRLLTIWKFSKPKVHHCSNYFGLVVVAFPTFHTVGGSVYEPHCVGAIRQVMLCLSVCVSFDEPAKKRKKLNSYLASWRVPRDSVTLTSKGYFYTRKDCKIESTENLNQVLSFIIHKSIGYQRWHMKFTGTQ